MELFSTEGERSALPFPIQAQAWPCALAGFDVIAVAPTGGLWGGGFFFVFFLGGKFLGFLLGDFFVGIFCDLFFLLGFFLGDFCWVGFFCGSHSLG